MKYWEAIADQIAKEGWTWGYTSFLDDNLREVRIVDAHRSNGRRFVSRSGELLTAFLALKEVLDAEAAALN